LVLLSVFVLPDYLITRDIGGSVGKLKPAQLLTAKDNVRKTLLQGIGGLLFLATAFFTWQQLKVSRENHTTEQFTKAVDHLGSEQMDVRVGGIYALERIARASKRGQERGPILEILTSYVRQHAQKDSPQVQNGSVMRAWFSGLMVPKEGNGQQNYSDPSKIPPLDADVDAALLVLARRLFAKDDVDLQLARTDLRRTMLAMPKVKVAQLSRVNLQEALLPGSNLQDADLTAADLWQADFRWSNLQGAKLCNAYLREAKLCEAELQGADLKDACLQGADLKGALLQGADLKGADLKGAKMQKAKLQGANLTGAKLDGAALNGVEGDNKTQWPEGFTGKVSF
jgi:hypothetical protein